MSDEDRSAPVASIQVPARRASPVTGPSDRVLDRLVEEARGTIERQGETVSELERKGFNLLRFSVLVTGLIVTGITVVARAPAGAPAVSLPVFVLFVLGLASMAGATVAVILALGSKQVRVGLQAEALVGVLDYEPFYEELTEEIIRAYGDGIIENAGAIDRATERMAWALMGVLGSVLALSAAAIGLLLQNAPRWF